MQPTAKASTGTAADGPAPRIAAAICTYNRHDLLALAIDSCLAQDMALSDYEIIVVDNSPDHAAAAQFGEAYKDRPNLTYMVEKTPGLSNARNVAARHTRADVIAYLDDDAIAKPNWLRELVRAFESFGPSAMIAGGKISPIWDVPRPAWLGDSKLGHVSVVDWGGATRVIKRNEWIAGANISFRRAPLLQIGGFDTELGRKGPESSLLSNEETDVLRKLSDLGGLALYVPEAEVDHLVDRRRLDQMWFRRRSAWQAVSDSINDPTVDGWAADAMDNALEYLLRQPPRYRSVAGFNRPLEDPEDFEAQLDAIYNYTIAMLSGFKGKP
ncbi:glycosyltransferase family 2 protein [Marinibacterium sp. SX1]|uniref:glycosyltransferase family 2 protein n=1 Tax=Marinibacterium sp. SX1 TaxID=3388424 RepID=UPI003D175BD4